MKCPLAYLYVIQVCIQSNFPLPDIIAFYESAEGQREFIEWKENQIKGKALKVQNISDLRNVGKDEAY